VEIGLILLVTFLGLIFLGLPIAYSMGISALVGLVLGNYPIEILPDMVTSGTSGYTLIAIPYFVLAGNLMNFGGITHRIFDFSNAAIGHIKGGLAQVNVLASMIFSGISGTASADAAGLGLVEIEAMTDKGYDKSFATAVTLASSVIGPVIPPSVPFLIYAMLANVSIARLFIAGIIPGVMVGIILMLTNYYLYKSGRVVMPDPEPYDSSKLVSTFKNGFFALLAPIVLLSSIMSGFVTPTEAGIIAVVYSVLVGLIYKELSWDGVKNALRQTVYSAALIMFLVGMGKSIGWVSTIERIPAMTSDFLFALTTNKFLMLIIVNLFLILLGMVLDGMSIKLIMIPILLPIMDMIGVDRIQFGVIMTFNSLVGYSTPPVGVGLFIMSSITDLPLTKVIKAFMPYYVPLIISLLLVTFIPWITMWLPSVVFK
jgi:tripartite ATP-independent transporter DctM subunit